MGAIVRNTPPHLKLRGLHNGKFTFIILNIRTAACSLVHSYQRVGETSCMECAVTRTGLGDVKKLNFFVTKCLSYKMLQNCGPDRTLLTCKRTRKVSGLNLGKDMDYREVLLRLPQYPSFGHKDLFPRHCQWITQRPNLLKKAIIEKLTNIRSVKKYQVFYET